ncbi:MAG: carbohydrate ABC transporter permease [Lachnospiraceae bacterium]
MLLKKKLTVFDVCNYLLLTVLCVVTLYPIVYVIMASISDPLLLEVHDGLLLWPQGFSLDAYEMVISDSRIITGYRNTIMYVVLGTSINMFMTSLGAFVLSRKTLYIRKFLMIAIIITMQFGGGLIPTYLVVSGILGTSIWTQVIPGAIAAMNLIILRTGFESIPDSLIESAKIDGANDLHILLKITLPLSKAVLAVIALYYGVEHWNQWLKATIYLRSRDFYPLQVFLREILIESSVEETMLSVATTYVADMTDVIKYASIMVSIIPVLCVYPFIQKFFVKGVMAGAVKG